MKKQNNTLEKTDKSTRTKKINVTNKVETVSATDELRKLSTILIVIVGVICVFYIITVIVTKNNQNLQYQLSDNISQISYTDILASDILKKDVTYYVLVKEKDEPYISLYETYISSYIAKEDYLNVYYVDLNDALNQNYKAVESNFDISNLKFKDTTLLKIANGSIESVYNNNNSINQHLKSLINE